MEESEEKKIIVIGHKNPDTDSICSAIAYANFKNKTEGNHFEACRAGDVSLETQYVLDRFGVPAPRRVFSVATQVDDLELDDMKGMSKETSMRSAWKAMRKVNASTLPLVSGDGKLEGMISLNDLAKANMDNLDAQTLAQAETPVKNIVEILDGKVLTGDADQVITSGQVRVAAGGPDTIRSSVGKDDIVLLSNREDAQIAAIEADAGIIVVCLGASLTKKAEEEAKAAGTTVIGTNYDTFAAARLIVQSVPVRSFMTPFDHLIGFTPETPVETVQNVMEGSRHINFPVFTQEDDTYLGLVNRGSLLTKKGKKLILVDHNEKAQCVDGFEDAEILEIIDHHKIGDMETKNPIRFINQPVGCTATILYGMYRSANVEIEPKIAGLLLSAIESDTLEFRSPTCTELDVRAGEDLAKIAGVDAHQNALEMFGAGESLEGRTPSDICYSDFKIFTKGDMRFAVGQASFMNPDNLQKAVDMLVPFLPDTLEHDGTSMVFFMATDIAEQSSRVIYAGDGAEDVLKRAFGASPSEGEKGVLLPGVVSRKKQMIPPIMGALD